MRIVVVAALAVAALAAAIAITALASAHGAPAGRGVLVRSAAAGAPVVPVRPMQLGACAIGGGTGSSAVDVTGPCAGRLAGSFTCVHSSEVEAISIRRPAGRGAAFYLTIEIPEYTGPGDYSQDDAAAQVVGPFDTPRWADLGYGVDVHVAPHGVFDLAQAVLLPESGTPATGVITLSGRAVCG